MSQSVSLNEFIEQGYELEKLKPYEDFLIECSQKDYGSEWTQVHHILPTSMNGSDDKNNLIILNYEDHYNAHMILANCFPEGSKERSKNLLGANIICHNVIYEFKKTSNCFLDVATEEFWQFAATISATTMSGKNHRLFGRKYSKPKEIIKSGKPSRNPSGKSKDGRSGSIKGVRKHSEETKRLMSIRKKEICREFYPLPEGVFETFNDSGDSIYNRTCQCGRNIQYKVRGCCLNAFKKNKKCKDCCLIGYPQKSKGKPRPVQKPEGTVGKYVHGGLNGSLTKIVIDSETGKIYGNKKEACNFLRVGSPGFEKLVKHGLVLIFNLKEVDKMNIKIAEIQNGIY